MAERAPPLLLTLLTLALLLALSATPAEAHKLKVFATAVGPVIEGRAYFSGGGAARGIAVTVETPTGERLAALHTDLDGHFRLTATRRVDHVIVADTGDGHAARFVIAAAQLPDDLAAEPPSGAIAAQAAPVTPPAAPPALPEAEPALKDMIAEAVARQVAPLEAQLNAYEDQTRLRDVLGGLGYILGLAGLALWLRARQRTGHNP